MEGFDCFVAEYLLNGEPLGRIEHDYAFQKVSKRGRKLFEKAAALGTGGSLDFLHHGLGHLRLQRADIFLTRMAGKEADLLDLVERGIARKQRLLR